MPPSGDVRIRQQVDIVGSIPRTSGEYRLTNDEDAYAIVKGNLRLHRGPNLSIHELRARFGGEYVLRLAPQPNDAAPQTEQQAGSHI